MGEKNQRQEKYREKVKTHTQHKTRTRRKRQREQQQTQSKEKGNGNRGGEEQRSVRPEIVHTYRRTLAFTHTHTVTTNSQTNI